MAPHRSKIDDLAELGLQGEVTQAQLRKAYLKLAVEAAP